MNMALYLFFLLIAANGKQHKYSSTEEWINNYKYSYHKMQLNSNNNKKKLLIQPTRSRNLKIIMLNKRIQTTTAPPKNDSTYTMIPFL